MEIVFFWILLAAGVGALAASRGRSFPGFFLLSLFLSPLLGLIVVLVTRNLALEERQAEERRREEERKEFERKREHERQLEQIRALAPKPTDSEPKSVRSIADEIQKLGELKDKGLLTDDEFRAQKAALLR